MNPLLKQWTTPRETPPFNEIKKEHWLPAFEEAIAEAKKDIQAIVGNEAAPNFRNTVVALDRAGDRLSTVADLFCNLLECNGDDEMNAIRALDTDKPSRDPDAPGRGEYLMNKFKIKD